MTKKEASKLLKAAGFPIRELYSLNNAHKWSWAKRCEFVKGVNNLIAYKSEKGDRAGVAFYQAQYVLYLNAIGRTL